VSLPSPLPPFRQVLTGLDLPPADETRSFDLTLGRAHREAHADAPETIPVLSVALESERGVDADFELTSLIGRGGMGEVWLARQRSLGRDVAIKIPPDAADEAVERALVSEARVTGALEHPSIVPVHALGRSAAGQPVLVMKRIEGVSWRDLLRSPQHPQWANLGPEEPLIVHVQILMQLCNALELAHRRGFVHRDVKPANVMVGSFGEVYLVDWGLAVAIDRPPRGHRRLEGTPAYMAPEMIAGLPADARTDVYLLGATLHEVLTGTPPHEGRSLVEVLDAAYAAAELAYPGAPPDLADLCRQAMSRDPARRPQTARAFRDRLAAILSHRSAAALARRGRDLLDSIGKTDGLPSHRRAVLEESSVTLRLACQEWPENPVARSTMADWRRIALELEIDEGNLAAARRLLDQVRAEPEIPPADLAARVDALERRLARERDEAATGRRARFDLDTRIGARERRVIGWSLIGATGAIGLVALAAAARDSLTPRDLVVFTVVVAAVFLPLVAILRRRLLGNRFTRQTVTLLGLLLGMLAVHRTAAWLADRPVAETLAGDLLIIAGVSGAGGIALAPWWFAGLVAGLCGSLLILWRPALALPTFSVVVQLLALSAVFSWTRDARRDETRATSPPDPPTERP
jgi:serine/threonine-protein kinase